MGLVSNTTLFTGTLMDHFNTFSRPVIIFKQPSANIINNNTADVYAGYGPSSIEAIDIINYNPISGIYPAQIIYKAQNSQLLGELEIRQFKGEVRVKCLSDARDFIKNGKTEYFLVDNVTYNVISQEWAQSYLGLFFYYFDLNKTT